MERSDRIALAALIVSLLSAGATWRGYELNLARDQRELRSKRPAIDIRMIPSKNPVDITLNVSITNRSDINITPQAIKVSSQPTIGFDSGIGALAIGKAAIGEITSPVAFLLEMGTIKPGQSREIALTARAKSPPFPTGMELQFTVAIRLADEQDSVEEYSLIRRVDFN